MIMFHMFLVSSVFLITGKYTILEKRWPNGHFFLGPAGSCLSFAQLVSFSIWGMNPPPTMSSLQSSKSLEHWRTEIVPKRSLGVQMSSLGVSIRKHHLTHQDTTCPPFLSLGPWRTGRILESSLFVHDSHMDGCQEQLLFWCLLQKMSFNPSRFHLSTISGVGSLEDRKGSRQESAF